MTDPGPQDAGGPRVRTVVLSDLHLGETTSLLSPFDPHAGTGGEMRPGAPAPALDALCAALVELLEPERDAPPTLVLAGDAMGLAYASLPEAGALLTRFLRPFVEPDRPLVSDVIYLAGNHDHHVWEMAREREFTTASRDGSPGDGWPSIRHATGARREDALPSDFLAACLGRAGGQADRARLLYPNLILQSEDGRRTALIHHGHFAEAIYSLPSRARRVLLPEVPAPRTVEDLEAENFAWIDFLWSTLGRSGALGPDIESFFLLARNPAAMDEEVGTYAKRIAGALDYPYLPSEWAEGKLTETLLRKLTDASSGERYSRRDVCGPDTVRGLMDYLTGPCRLQSAGTLGQGSLTLIWGHTHKPFEKRMDLPDIEETGTVLNTGGWTIDFPEPDPLRGASVLLLDDELNDAVIRVFNDTGDTDGLRCRVSWAPGDGTTPFREEIARRIRGTGSTSAPGGRDPRTPAWTALGNALAAEIPLRRHYLRDQRPE